jgi:hypothetical protein
MFLVSEEQVVLNVFSQEEQVVPSMIQGRAGGNLMDRTHPIGFKDTG